MTIYITGLRGFLGGELAREFRGRGHSVVPDSLPRLGEPFDDSVFAGVEAILHCAHDFASGAMAKNVAGTRAWLEAGRRRGVARQIYVSSYSARKDAESEYGRAKFALERVFLDVGQTVVRPGLVIGDGGLFAKQRRALLRTPVVPLIGGGRQPTAVIGTGHLSAAVAAILEGGLTGAFNLFYEPMPSAREFAQAVKSSAGQWARFLPIPMGAALGLAHAAAALRLPVPVRPDQVRALAGNASAPWRSDLPEVLPGREGEFRLEWALARLRSS